MQQADYIKERLDNQINWMENKARINQQRYKLVKILEITSASSIPFLVGFHGTHPLFLTITGFLGVFIVFLNGVQQLYKFHETWLTYRTTIESLRREKMLFENHAGSYTEENSFRRFVENIEALLANENKIWLNTITQRAEQAK